MRECCWNCISFEPFGAMCLESQRHNTIRRASGGDVMFYSCTDFTTYNPKGIGFVAWVKRLINAGEETEEDQMYIYTEEIKILNKRLNALNSFFNEAINIDEEMINLINIERTFIELKINYLYKLAKEERNGTK
jgi:hypothetical protein